MSEFFNAYMHHPATVVSYKDYEFQMTKRVGKHNVNAFSYMLFTSRSRPQALEKSCVFHLFKGMVIYLKQLPEDWIW